MTCFILRYFCVSPFILNVCSINMETGETHKKLVNEVPELPFDKSFHVFMCFSNENEPVAKELVQKLEGIGIKCCLHSRDFLPGSDILSNMNINIEKSMYVVILLSEHYYKSDYCSHETSVALHSKIKYKTNVLPVKIEPCEIPSVLSHITCINCEDGDYVDLHTMIYNAVINQEKLQAEQKVPTGKMVTVVPKLIGNSYRITIEDEIRNGHPEISDETFDMAELTINRSFALRTFDTRDSYCYAWSIGFVIGCLFLIEVLSLWVLGCFSGKPVVHVINCYASPFILIFGGIFVSVCVFVCMLPHCRCTEMIILRLERKAFNQLNTRLWESINKNILWRKHIIMFFRNRKTYFCNRIESYKNCQIGATESKEECTRRTFGEYLTMNSHKLHTEESDYTFSFKRIVGETEIRLLIDGMITERLNKHDLRHETKNNVPCLCLLVEEWLQHGKEQQQN